MALVRTIYHEVHLALWALLAAFVIVFAVRIVPKLPARVAKAERVQQQEIAAVNEAYCTKWHMGPGTPMHDACLSDLHALRKKIENRITEEADF